MMVTEDDLREDTLSETMLVMNDDGEIIYTDDSEAMFDGFFILDTNPEPEAEYYPTKVKIEDVSFIDDRFAHIDTEIDAEDNIIKFDSITHDERKGSPMA